MGICGVDVFMMRWIKSQFAELRWSQILRCLCFSCCGVRWNEIICGAVVFVWLGDAVFVNFSCAVQAPPCPPPTNIHPLLKIYTFLECDWCKLFIIWLALWTVKMKQILHCDWLPVHARWRVILPALDSLFCSCNKILPKSKRVHESFLDEKNEKRENQKHQLEWNKENKNVDEFQEYILQWKKK